MEAAIKSSIFSLVREKKISVDFPETTNPPVTKKKKKLFLLVFSSCTSLRNTYHLMVTRAFKRSGGNASQPLSAPQPHQLD